MIRIFCDRCGKDITRCNRIGYIALNSRDQKEGDLKEDNEFERNHYCNNCMSQIREFIKTKQEGLVQELAQEVVQEENNQNSEESHENNTKCHENEKKCTQNAKKCNESKKKSIDIGKIMALKNAGWKNKDIAGEMHMDPQAVANAIYNHKKKSTP